VTSGAERRRLAEDAQRHQDWKRWGPYLSERQWGTVREDYSSDGTAWDYFPHDHARSRTYRWGEDGLLGITDRQARMCFALALWNGRDPILKERLFGLTGPEGNHGEDVKELYYYLDATPTSSYLKALYKYPQNAFPYARLVEENRRRSRHDPEFELLDTGVFDSDRYFDVLAEYAKSSPNDVLIRLTVSNRGPDPATLHLLPTLWLRNTWSWGRDGQEAYWPRGRIAARDATTLVVDHPSLGAFRLAVESSAGPPAFLFTENETNFGRLYGIANPSPYTKDAFHRHLIDGEAGAINPAATGSKAAAYFTLVLPAGGSACARLRLVAEADASSEPFAGFDDVFAARIAEADDFYDVVSPPLATAAEKQVLRQACAGLLCSKQFYGYDVATWLAGDPDQPPPPESRLHGRNAEWPHLYNRDVISVPDVWEYPWYAAWDLAFHMIPFARIDPDFAKEQLILFLREWYMHPSGQLPAYEFAFSDVNPPVHAWAAWRVYKMTAARGARDLSFLGRVFQKCVLNFTWWVNRKDVDGRNLFGGGFLGLDNIGVFDRSRPLPSGGRLEQADGTAWMAFYCGTLLSMALELAARDTSYEDMASKFFEHYIAIADAMNTLGGTGLWSDDDGFYYDHLRVDGREVPLRIRSLVGLVPLIAVEVLEQDTLDRLPAFCKRMQWFIDNRRDLAPRMSYMQPRRGRRLLAIPGRERLERLLRYMLDEKEFLSPYGIRSVSRVHQDHPFRYTLDGQCLDVGYMPGESTIGIFGGNSNWRGPVWFPLNYLLIEALERYHHFHGDDLLVELPTGSGRRVSLLDAAYDLRRRLASLFLPDATGRRPCHGDERRYAEDLHFRDLVLFYEYFHGDTGRGCGASHQTGWTALVAPSIQELARARSSAATR
jgi:Mannosylglycerate hydrolase MGH1-like glycoside hydrolase domain